MTQYVRAQYLKNLNPDQSYIYVNENRKIPPLCRIASSVCSRHNMPIVEHTFKTFTVVGKVNFDQPLSNVFL